MRTRAPISIVVVLLLAELILFSPLTAQEPIMPFTTILSEARRQGTFTSATVLAGQIIPANATVVTIRAIMSVPVRNDPTLSMSFNIYKSSDGGATWQHDIGGRWVGGSGFVDRSGVLNPPISVRFEGPSLDAIRGKRLRAEVDIPVEMRVGLEAEIQ